MTRFSKMIRNLATLILVAFSCSVMAQNLTIATNGETTPGANWSSSESNNIVTITFTGTATIAPSVIQGHLNSNKHVVVQSGTGGTNIIISNSITSTSAQLLTFKSAGNITLGTSITTAGGGVIFWADSDISNNGSISLLASASIQTNGGVIALAGGADNGSNSGIANDGIPDGFAKGIDNPGISTVNSFTISSAAGNIILRGSSNIKDGILLSSSTTGDILSTSGNIEIIGQVDASASLSDFQTGIRTTQSGTITVNSGTGTIKLDGKAPRYGIGFGIALISNAYNSDGSTRTEIKSGNTTSGAINIQGESTTTSGHGITIRGASTKIHAIELQGGIEVDAVAVSYTTTIYCPTELLAKSGPIIWSNNASADGEGLWTQNSITGRLDIGSKDGVTGLSSSNSDVTISLGKIANHHLGSTPNILIGTTGGVTIQGVGGTASFGNTYVNSVFTTFNSNSQTMRSFTFGSPNNTQSVTLSQPLSVAGPITINGGTITVDASISATGDLTFSGSSLVLNTPITIINNDVIIGSNTTVPANSTNYFKTTGTGTIKRSIASGSSFTFPVGNTTYNSVAIQNRTGAADIFSVRVANEVLTNGTSGTAITDKVVNRTWHIGKTNPNGSLGVNMTFQWDANQELGTMTDRKLSHHNNTLWALATGTSGNVTISGTTKTMTHSGYTGTFSPFAIGSTGSALPVTWQSFTAKKHPTTVELNWSTASEQNTKDFEVQYSTNTQDWSALGTVAAAGNSSVLRSYQFIHNSPLKGNVYNYYRILQRDLDGKFSYSKIVSIIYNEPGIEVQVYPNPVKDIITIYLAESQQIRLVNMAGATVWQGSMAAGRNQLLISHLPKGVYTLITLKGPQQILIQ
jgi:hypothetical protein